MRIFAHSFDVDAVLKRIAMCLDDRQENLAFRFVPLAPALIAGEELEFELQVIEDQGSPTRFSPVMDSYAHIVAFDAAGTGFAHLHPRNPIVEGQDPLDPDLHFTIKFDEPGHYRVWAQFIVNGKHIFAPFDLMIEAA